MCSCTVDIGLTFKVSYLRADYLYMVGVYACAIVVYFINQW